MRRGESNDKGRKKNSDGIVDYRYSLVILEILERKWIVSMYLRPYQIAELLDVSRTTVYEWMNRKSNISKATAWRFKDCGGVRGYFAQRVLEIHNDSQRQRVKRLFENSATREVHEGH